MSRELKTEPQGAQLLKRWAKKWELVNETVLVRVLQRNGTNKMYISMHTELHICISDQYQNSQVGWQPGAPGEVSVGVQRQSAGKIHFSSGDSGGSS